LFETGGPVALIFDCQVKGLVFRLIHQDVIDESNLLYIYYEMDQLIQAASDAQLVEILSYLEHSDGSALPFSAGLFHARQEIQMAAARIILRLFVQKVFFANYRLVTSI
jgi:hypothetical protein